MITGDQDIRNVTCVADAPRSATRSAVILFAHGSRDPDWVEPFRAIQQKVCARNPDVTVELAFLQLMQPTLDVVVDRLAASGHTTFTIAPLFMAEGAHLKRDLARLVAQLQARHPAVQLRLLPAAGEAETVLDAISAWVAGAI